MIVLRKTFSTFEKINYQEFEKSFPEILNKHALMKKKLVGANQAPYMTKALRKAMMRRSELATKNKRYFESLLKTEKLLQQTIQERKGKLF